MCLAFPAYPQSKRMIEHMVAERDRQQRDCDIDRRTGIPFGIHTKYMLVTDADHDISPQMAPASPCLLAYTCPRGSELVPLEHHDAPQQKISVSLTESKTYFFTNIKTKPAHLSSEILE